MSKETNDEQDTANDPTSFVIPNVIPFLFPIYWWCVLAIRWLTDKILGTGNRKLATIVLDGLIFAEAPRIHNGLLYFVDMYGQTILVYDFDRSVIVKQVNFPYLISGLGWLPDGRLLVVAMKERKLVAIDEQSGEKTDYADLQTLSRYRCNDMCVDSLGRAYVGNFGFDSRHMWRMRATTLARVDPDGTVTPAARRLFFPNGTVVTPDGLTLIVAETLAGQLVAFDIASDGSLLNRRVWAYVGLPVDGICLDENGRIWAAAPQIGIMGLRGGAVRVSRGGHIDSIIGFGANGLDRGVIACSLRAENGCNQLILLLAKSHEEQLINRYQQRNAQVAIIDVDAGPARMSQNPNYHAGYC